MTSVTIPSSVTSVEPYAFEECPGLKGVYFRGNAPRGGDWVFHDSDSTIVYRLPDTTGWGPRWCGRPTALWKPQAQTVLQP